MNVVKIADRWVGDDHPTYFIADISANHDGDLERAKALIHQAADAGAEAAKFQNFRAAKIVSDVGFRSLGVQLSHQASWKKSVFEVYQAASLPFEWTPILHDTCRAAGIHYFSSPYDFEAVDMLDPLVPAHKIGSGDITWIEMCRHIAGKGKPVLLATGASELGDVERAVHVIVEINPDLILAVQHELHRQPGELSPHPSARSPDLCRALPAPGPGALGPHPGPRHGARRHRPWGARRGEAFH